MDFNPRVSQWGVKPEYSAGLAKRIVLSNQLGVVFALYLLFCAGMCFLSGRPIAGVLALVFMGTQLLFPVLNLLGHHQVSRTSMMVISNLLGFSQSVLLPNTGFNQGFYITVGLSIVLFMMDQKRLIALGFLLPLVLYPLTIWIERTHLLGPGLDLTALEADVLRYSSAVFYVTIVFLMFLFLSQEHERAEEQIRHERTRYYKQAKFAALGQMAAGITHEINNPMTVIDLNVQQLNHMLQSESYSQEEVLSRMQVISWTVHRIARIVESMLTFSREGEKDNFAPEPVNKIVEDTLTICAEKVRFKRVDLRVNLSPSELRLNCRSGQISQVMLNLLNNAFDAVEDASEKWIAIDVSEDEAKKKTLISVTDSGPGISAELREKIFLPFFTTKAVGRGTGLGLSLSKKILLDHGGSLTLDPASPHTRFVLEFENSWSRIS